MVAERSSAALASTHRHVRRTNRHNTYNPNNNNNHKETMDGAVRQEEDIAVLLPLLGKTLTPPDDPPLPPPDPTELLQQQLRTAQPTQYAEQEEESTPSYTSSATTESSTSRSMDTARLSGRAMELVRIDLWQYVGCLGLGLMVYVAFLLLPKGMRKAYCRSERRRYVRRFPRNSKPHSRHFADDFYNDYRDVPSHALERPTSFSKPTSSSSVHDSVLEEVEARRKQQQQEEHDPEKPTPFYTRANSNIIRSRSDPGDNDDDDDDSSSAWPSQAVTEEDNTSSRVRPLSIASSDAAIAAHQTPSPHKHKPQSNRPFTTTDMDRLVHDITSSSSSNSNGSPASPRRPAPDHPQIWHVPDERIWRESLRRLGDRGVRLTAHGVQCDPKRIWLTHIQDDTAQHSLQWQTEFPRHVPNTETGSSSIVLMRGAVHTIPLPNVLYIDVGKKTSALQKTTALVPPSACFSLLTQQGSLDLQTNSKLERDAVVSALSYLLDHVHTGGDWRTLYQDSASSTVTTSVTGRDTPSTIRTTELVFPPTTTSTSAADI